jgi:Domain of unknown function (DUF4160)
MPEISRFYGIVIKMFHNDHQPPHFYAEVGDSEMLVAIETLGIIAGRLPPRATGMVIEWAAQHQEELRHIWDQARNREPLDRVEPLR